jgi:hypothetical protein
MPARRPVTRFTVVLPVNVVGERLNIFLMAGTAKVVVVNEFGIRYFRYFGPQ